MATRYVVRHRGAVEHRGEDRARLRLDDWNRSVHSAAAAIEGWPDSEGERTRQIKDWNLRQLEIRRRSILRGEEQK